MKKNVFKVFTLLLILYFVNLICIAQTKIMSPKESDELGAKIRELKNKGKYEEAIKLLDDKIKEYADDTNVIITCIYKKVNIYKDLKQYDKCIEAINSQKYLINISDIYHKNIEGNLQKKIIREADIDKNIYNQLTEIYEEMGEFEKALECCKKAEELAKIIFENSPETDAYKYIDFLQIGPGTYAHIYEKWGKYDLARQKWQEGIDWLSSPEIQLKIIDKLKPKTRLAWMFNRDIVFPLKIVNLYLKENNKEEAKSLLLNLKNKIEKLEYKEEMINYNEYHYNGRYNLVKKEIERYVLMCTAQTKIMSPEGSFQFNSRIIELKNQGKYEDAIKLIDEKIKEYPDDNTAIITCLDAKVGIYKNLEQYDKCIEAINSGKDLLKIPEDIKNNPEKKLVIESKNEKYIYNQLMKIYEKMGEFEKALECCKKAEELAKIIFENTPETDDNKYIDFLEIGPESYANIYKEWGKYDLARQKWQEAIDWLTSPTVQLKIINNLNLKRRLDWMFNRDVVFPLEIADVLITENKKEQTKAIIEKIKSVMEKKEYKEEMVKYEDYRYNNAKKQIEEYIQIIENKN